MDGQPKKRRSLNLGEKLAVIQEYSKSRSSRDIAKLFGCSCQTIQNILRHKEEYLEDWANNADPRRVRNRPNSRLRALHYVVYEWVRRCRYYPMRITDQLIRQTGENVAFLLGVPEIRQTTGWVSRFKDKYKLSNYDLMNTDREEVLTSTDEDKKSLDVESIIAEMREEYGNGTVPEVTYRSEDSTESDSYSIDATNTSNKRPKVAVQGVHVVYGQPQTLPLSSQLPQYRNNNKTNNNKSYNTKPTQPVQIIDTIDLTESVHSESENSEIDHVDHHDDILNVSSTTSALPSPSIVTINRHHHQSLSLQQQPTTKAIITTAAVATAAAASYKNNSNCFNRRR